MRRALRFSLWCLIVVALGGALLGYFVYSAVPEIPKLSGKLIKGTIEAGGRKRTYLDLHAARVDTRSTACGGDARFGSERCANGSSDGVWVRSLGEDADRWTS